MLRRLGYNVRILEQNLASTRTNHAAGLSTGVQGSAFFKAYDSSQKALGLPSAKLHFTKSNPEIGRGVPIPMTLTAWDVLYYRLRAMYDGFTSDYEPQAIADKEAEATGAGKVTFELGKKVDDVSYSDGLVTVGYQDLLNGGHGTMHADLVIAADGASSAVRSVLFPNVPRPYSGYVAFRGTVLERDVSPDTVKYLERQITYQILGPRNGLFVV